jgi:uncharacterized NAD(P)/FAD-binding protein YdhS
VAVVGGGAAGTLVAAHLRRRDPDLRITVIDGSGRPATGAAYGTTDPTHLLNVPAARMSAWPDDPDDLVRWLEEHAVGTAAGFAPRQAYGRYLGEVLAAADVRLEAAEVLGLVPGKPARLFLSDGRVVTADAVALATGRPPGTVPEPLARALAAVLLDDRTGRVVEDPWAPGALAELDARRPGRVLVVGSGLTGVDVALHLVARGVEVTLVSRHGQLPRRHRTVGPPFELSAVAALGDGVPLDALRTAMAADHAAARAAGADWRQVVDALRPLTATLWRSLSWADQRRFLREDLRGWEVLRHRMPPSVADAIDGALACGSLSIVAAELAEARLDGDGIETILTTADGSLRRHDDALVVATGTSWDARALHSSPLWSALLDEGTADLHPSGIGVRTDGDGRLVDARGRSVPGVVCVGMVRQGELWESTAIPEIRQQAAAAAALLAAEETVAVDDRPQVRPEVVAPVLLPERSPADRAYDEGVRRLLAVRRGAARALHAALAADPDHVRSHAALAVLATERPRPGGTDRVREHLDAARAAAPRASQDDQSHLSALSMWCEAGSRAGTPALLEHLQRVPDDAVALAMLAPSIAFAGAGDALPDVWGYVDRFASVHGEAPWYLGLLANGRTEQLRFFDAADLAEAALDADPTNGNAAHGLAHVHYETDAHGTGLRWLGEWIGSDGRTQRFLPHFQWHAALHELAMGDAAAAARRSWPRSATWPPSRGPRSSPSTPCCSTPPTTTSGPCGPPRCPVWPKARWPPSARSPTGSSPSSRSGPARRSTTCSRPFPPSRPSAAAGSSRRWCSRPPWPPCSGWAPRARPPASSHATVAPPPQASPGAR